MLGYLKQSSGDNLMRRSDYYSCLIPMVLDNLLADANCAWISASNFGSVINSYSYLKAGVFVTFGISNCYPFLAIKPMLSVTFFNRLTNVGETITSNGIFMKRVK